MTRARQECGAQECGGVGAPGVPVGALQADAKLSNGLKIPLLVRPRPSSRRATLCYARLFLMRTRARVLSAAPPAHAAGLRDCRRRTAAARASGKPAPKVGPKPRVEGRDEASGATWRGLSGE